MNRDIYSPGGGYAVRRGREAGVVSYCMTCGRAWNSGVRFWCSSVADFRHFTDTNRVICGWMHV